MITPVDDTEYEYSLPDSHFLPLPPIEALERAFRFSEFIGEGD